MLECPNEIHGMIDMAKLADIVVLIIDASIGFEMETFEFLTLLNVILRLIESKENRRMDFQMSLECLLTWIFSRKTNNYEKQGKN